jgi:hypothetical protein
MGIFGISWVSYWRIELNHSKQSKIFLTIADPSGAERPCEVLEMLDFPRLTAPVG